jgi:hypothetical protein
MIVPFAARNLAKRARLTTFQNLQTKKSKKLHSLAARGIESNAFE